MNAAVFLPNWIGDVVMATPAIRALRELHPGGKLIGVMQPYVADVLAGTTWLDDVILLPTVGPRWRRWANAIRALRQRRVDVAVLFPNSFRSGLLAYLGGCRERIGYDRSGRHFFLTDRVPPLRTSTGEFAVSPVIDAYNALAVRAGATPSVRLELGTTAADEAAADREWERCRLGSGVVCLNPGAAFGAAKHWPSEHFAELARRLIDRRGATVLVLCGPAERDLAREIVVKTARPGRIHSLADSLLSLGLTKACVRRCALLITTDSGPRHFAAAFGRPVVALFGPTHIGWTETYFAREIKLQKKLPCGPCQQRVCPEGHHRCMTELLPADVGAAAERLLVGEVRRAG